MRRARNFGAGMLDNHEKAQRLLASLKASLPFEVELTPSLAQHLRGQHVASADNKRHGVSDVSYAGDEGGIVCHIVPPDGREALIVSLTHVQVPRSMPLATAIAEYQKHRIKKLKKQKISCLAARVVTSAARPVIAGGSDCSKSWRLPMPCEK